jgi:uncharacterized protein (TIGR00266 family)
MEIALKHQPANAIAQVRLQSGESCVAEGGSMVCMRGPVEITTSTHSRGSGGLLSGLKRLVGGESFIVNHYRSNGTGGEVWLAPALTGDLLQISLGGVGIVAESGSFLMTSGEVQMTTGWQGFKNIMSGESLFWLKFGGSGTIVLNSFGAIIPVDVNGEYIVDTGHIVAFEETLNFTLSKAGASWVGSFLGGEGIVCRFKGKGRLWIQSHQARSFGQGLSSMLRPR